MLISTSSSIFVSISVWRIEFGKGETLFSIYIHQSVLIICIISHLSGGTHGRREINYLKTDGRKGKNTILSIENKKNVCYVDRGFPAWKLNLP